MMFRYLLTSLLALCSLAAVAQTQVYPTMKVDGSQCFVHPSSTLDEFTKDFFLPDGDWVGLYKGRYEGEIAFTGTIKSGRVQGICKQYYENGAVKSIESYDYGHKHGTFMFFAEDGTNIGEISYSEDLPHGTFAYRTPLGDPLRSGEYYMGKPVGTWLWYYRGGTQLRRQREYVDGYPSGKWTEWYENGQLRSEQFYVDSAIVGRPSQKPPYPDGVWQEFYPSGKIKSITTHENYYMASQETYFEDGKIATRKEYFNGKLTKQVSFWQNGLPMEERNYAPAAAMATRGFENGEEEEPIEVVAIRDGYTASWYVDGKIRYEGQYKNDKKHGEWKYYDNKKKLMRKIEYNMDVVVKDENF